LQEEDFSKDILWAEVLEPVTVNLMKSVSDSPDWDEEDNNVQS
jgi:hypothetical protein